LLLSCGNSNHLLGSGLREARSSCLSSSEIVRITPRSLDRCRRQTKQKAMVSSDRVTGGNSEGNNELSEEEFTHTINNILSRYGPFVLHVSKYRASNGSKNGFSKNIKGCIFANVLSSSFIRTISQEVYASLMNGSKTAD